MTEKYSQASLARWLFSMEYPFFFTSVGLYSVLFTIYVLVYVYSDDRDAVLGIGIPFHLWGWGIWAYQLWLLITQSYWKMGSRLFSIPTFLYVITVYQFTIAYTMVRDRFPDSFVGVDGDFSRISQVGLLAFLAGETIPGLGTGSVFANTSVFGGTFLIALNSITGWVLIGFIFSVVVVVFDLKVETRLEDEKNQGNSLIYASTFYKKYNQWLYYTEEGQLISSFLSLEYPYFFTSVSAYFLLSFFPFIIVFSLTENSPAIITLGIINLVWSAFIWVYQLFLLLSLSFKKIDITLLSSPSWLFVINLVSFAVIYSVVRHEDPNAFTGFVGNFSNISIFGIASFLSSETSTGLGTGATFANNSSWVPFLVVTVNSVFFTVLNAVLLSSVLVVFSPHARKAMADDKKVK